MRKKNVYGDSTWKDKLTSYNGTTITYDTIGNPLSDGTWTYTWQAGRQLKKMAKSGMTVEFKYDHNGLRTEKKVTENGVTTVTSYTLHGKLVTHMTVGSDKLHFFYDAQSRPAKVNFNGTIYTYLHNLQGDIVGIVDNSGNLVVEYKYDAWGELLSTVGSKATTLGKVNPFRYRGYVYDKETNFYHVGARYYAPDKSRFTNSDMIVRPWCGLYTYCCNAPIKYYDPNGTEEKCCWSGNALSIDVYIIKGANSDLLSQALSAEYIDTDLPSLANDLQKAVSSALIDIGKDESVSQLVSETAGGQTVGYLTGVVSNVVNALTKRKSKVCTAITNNFVTTRSNHNQKYSHTVMVFYYGHYETRFQMFHIDENGKDLGHTDHAANNGLDLSAVRAIHSTVSRIVEPVYHDHPKGFTTFSKYVDIIKECLH